MMRHLTRLLLLTGLMGPVAAWAVEDAVEVPAAPVVSATGALPTVPGVPSEAQAEAAYDAARRLYANGGVASDGSGFAGAVALDGSPEVVMLADPGKRLINGTDRPVNVGLEDIRLVIDVENTTLRDVFAEIVSQAAQYTGTWTVKWRLKPENMNLLDERVNLTAEAKFGDFVNLLTERVRNLGGVQLFVTAFNESRVILVTDTYY